MNLSNDKTRAGKPLEKSPHHIYLWPQRQLGSNEKQAPDLRISAKHNFPEYIIKTKVYNLDPQPHQFDERLNFQ